MARRAFETRRSASVTSIFNILALALALAHALLSGPLNMELDRHRVQYLFVTQSIGAFRCIVHPRETLNHHHLYHFWAVLREGGVTRASEGGDRGQAAATVADPSRLEARLGRQRFYAITVERKLRNPAGIAVSERAPGTLQLTDRIPPEQPRLPRY